MKKIKIEWPTVVALGLVVAALLAAYLAGPALGVPAESHAALVAGVGAIGATVLAALRQLLRRDDDGDGIPDVLQGGGPPPAGGAAAVLLAVVVAAPALTGCGASGLGLQADLVAFGGIGTARADEVIIAARAADLDEVVEEAAAECPAEGCPDDRAAYYRAELERRTETWRAVLACRAPVVESLRSWLDGLRTAQAVATDEVGLELLGVLGARFVAAYAAAGACVEGAGGPTLPGLPGPLAAVGGAS